MQGLENTQPFLQIRLKVWSYRDEESSKGAEVPEPG